MSELTDKEQLAQILASKKAGEDLVKKGKDAEKALIANRQKVSQLQLKIAKKDNAHEAAVSTLAQEAAQNQTDLLKKITITLHVDAKEAITDKIEARKLEANVGEKGGSIQINLGDLDQNDLQSAKMIIDQLQQIHSARFKQVANAVSRNRGEEAIDGFESYYQKVD